ncbi:MAG: ATP-grasp domain-containing protein [Limimaricola sp.]|uniref:acetyl/propionyl/methylcrotonyl-CoA carboxylase subunit alpha n=1 Tax=Limimaricola sp. TaxID=2211665 RepID=UPI001D41C765|nr:biotin carboxylase N-terminal domain-containing protein [Limimaricola sp.]MBI1418507.1 ATP-grasp domain-containing protein [Limimaricola sp.]
MFRRILIANRGEIARRIIHTCDRLGIETVAVHSDADAEALHVADATTAVRIGPAPVAESYLRGEAIIAAALQTGAEAIHPGYGFLSENPDFVAAVAEAGLIFIGPSETAIRAMGLKDAAKRLMAAAGVPVVPGYHGADQDPARLASEAAAIGYPVLIKAVAGGGGKGMRLVERPGEFAEALASARAEARAAFGNEAVLVEKFVTRPRHIEVQVFGDGTKAIHLYERDCSLQRRHQKVIEEAPAPGMTAEVRAAMGQAAVRAAEAIGYAGAGTVEFIVDGSDGLRPDGFWFMEMNTRLQVEHPVTEAVTGLDLVEWQLRVAAGEGLPLTQDEVRLDGHAIEARLYAEDVPAGFLPATGRLAHLTFPPGLRADSAVGPGDTISPWYDPMIAKLIAHGPDRETALARLAEGLAATEVAGTVTNLPFLRALAADADFVAARLDTGLIGRGLDRLVALPPLTPGALAQAVLMLTGLDQAADPLTGFTLWAPLDRAVEVMAEGRAVTVVIRAQGPDAHDLVIGDRTVAARRGRDGWRFDGVRALRGLQHGDRVTFPATGHVVALVDPLAQGVDVAGGDAVLAPMPGLVREVAVAEGDSVVLGQRVAVLEAMKMEHVLRAPRDGTVARVVVRAGEQVTAGALLVELEPGA